MDEPQPVAVEYDFEARILGQRYLCIPKSFDRSAGYATIPVAD